jgi:hypothetical protein
MSRIGSSAIIVCMVRMSLLSWFDWLHLSWGGKLIGCAVCAVWGQVGLMGLRFLCGVLDGLLETVLQRKVG